MSVRDDLWDVAVEQYGYVTAADARDLGIAVVELGKLAHRGRLERVSYGLYRFAEWPVSANDSLMEAVLWTRDPRAALSHDTALAVYEVSDINPATIHVTVPPRTRRIRRTQPNSAVTVHYERLNPEQIGWWEQIPTVTLPTAIDQCIATGVRTDIVTTAINTARRLGRIDEATANRQRQALRNPPR